MVPGPPDTAVVGLARAGCTLPEICSMTGHRPAYAANIIEHYWKADDEQAMAASHKLGEWLAAGNGAK